MKHSLDRVDELANELKKLLPMSKENQQTLDKKFRLEFNYNSNHMEGNTLTYGETELLLIFDDTKGNHTMREYEEMKAHDVAWQLVEEWAKEIERPLTEQNIKNLNEIILVRPFWKDAVTPDGQRTRRKILVGNYKEHPNSVRLANGEMFHYASPQETPILMQELIEWYRSEQNTLHPVTLAAMLHYKFVRIHPFDDGNGRISRLLMNYILLRNGLPPVIIKSDDKANYLHALHQADIGDFAPFIQYIAEQLIWSLEISIRAAKGESIEEPDDLDKKLAVLEKELNAVDPDQEVKWQMKQEVFYKIFDGWFSELIRKVVPEIQKFNKYFIETSHLIYIRNNIGQTSFVNERPDEIIKDLRANSLLKQHHFYTDVAIEFYTRYGTFIKGGSDSFGCNYSFEIKFDTIKYSIFLDKFQEEGIDRKREVFIENRLLHKPLAEDEINMLTKKLSSAIYEHIDYYTRKKGLR